MARTCSKWTAIKRRQRQARKEGRAGTRERTRSVQHGLRAGVFVPPPEVLHTIERMRDGSSRVGVQGHHQLAVSLWREQLGMLHPSGENFMLAVRRFDRPLSVHLNRAPLHERSSH